MAVVHQIITLVFIKLKFQFPLLYSGSLYATLTRGSSCLFKLLRQTYWAIRPMPLTRPYDAFMIPLKKARRYLLARHQLLCSTMNGCTPAPPRIGTLCFLYQLFSSRQECNYMLCDLQICRKSFQFLSLISDIASTLATVASSEGWKYWNVAESDNGLLQGIRVNPFSGKKEKKAWVFPFSERPTSR